MAEPDVICLTNGAFAENSYILADRETGDAVLIDPGEEYELFLRRLASEHLTLRGVWLTHAHLDHVFGVKAVLEAMPVPVALHPDDLPLYGSMAEQGGWLGLPAEQAPPPDRTLAHGDTVAVGGLRFVVRHIPGHSPGSVAFIGHGIAVVGDVLFAGSIGRTDVPGGDFAVLLTGIREHLLPLPDATVVYSGHGPATTIGRERATNPFLTGALRLA